MMDLAVRGQQAQLVKLIWTRPCVSVGLSVCWGLARLPKVCLSALV